ncbi:hypothetical protein P7H19_12805 [Paenibacillus larvae]|nr:hypothetical protein [Paenibacillus larvae]MDT2237001.1 hypothetical protein [Paenibacillus larvae]
MKGIRCNRSIRYDHRTEPGEGKAGRVIPCKAQAGGRLEIGGIGESDFDVIVSSVVHYFPNTLYLEEVIRSALRPVERRRNLHLDDLLDHRKKGGIGRVDGGLQRGQPGVPVKTSWDEDLFVDESFFRIWARQRSGNLRLGKQPEAGYHRQRADPVPV